MKRYYQRHKEEIKIRQKAYREKNRERLNAKRRAKYIPRTPWNPKLVDGPDGRRFFTIGAISEFTGYTTHTLRTFERWGQIPKALYANSKGWRLYTRAQTVLLVDLLKKLRNKETSKAHVAEKLKECWNGEETKG